MGRHETFDLFTSTIAGRSLIEPARAESRFASSLAGLSAVAANQHSSLPGLGSQFDALHAAWLLAVEVAREPGERFDALMAAAKARGGPTMKDIEALWSLPGVRETHDAEDAAYAALCEVANTIMEQPARTAQDLAVQARAVIPSVWPGGTFGEVAALGCEEDVDKEAVRALIESCFALAGVDWRGQPIASAKAGPPPEPSVSDQIVANWREWSAQPDFDESEAGQAEFDRLSNMRNALIDAADALPATPENVLPKALASAWIEYVALWSNGQAREEYGTDGRLALDIDTAITGRLKTTYLKGAA